MSEKNATENFQKLDFVYCGVRLFNKKDLVVILAPMNPDGTLADERAYDYKKTRDRTIGGIYTGAEFSDTHSRAIDDVTYKGLYADSKEVLDWKMRNDQAKSIDRLNKLEKDDKKTNEIDEWLLPLRKLYTGYRKRNDYAGLEALEAAVLRSLKTPVRQSEEKL